MLLLRVRSAPSPPFPPGKVGLGEPGLVDVQDALPRLQQLHHLVRELLPQDQVLVGVRSVRDSLDAPIAQPQSLLEDCTHQLIGDAGDPIQLQIATNQ